MTPRPAVLEAGPALLRRLDAGGLRDCDPEAAAAALEAVDDPVALLGERPVPSGDLWRSLVGDLLAGHTGPVAVVHPGWWPRARVEWVLDAVGDAATGPVSGLARGQFIAARVRGAPVVVEVGGDLAAVGGGGVPAVLVGDRTEEIAATAARRAGPGAREILLDPAGVTGADRCADELSRALRRRGLGSRVVDLAAIAGRDPVPDGRRWRPVARLSPVAPVAGVLAAAALAVGVAGSGGGTASPAQTAGTSLAEGPVAVTVPPDWTVRRVTAGPGSRRVEVTSPADPLAVLHITWSRAAGATLADAAAALGRAAAGQPAGVFVDFRPDGRAEGRPAVTYAEVRPGRVIRWSVLLDGGTRIGVGCQSAADRPDAIGPACAGALASVRERAGPPG